MAKVLLFMVAIIITINAFAGDIIYTDRYVQDRINSSKSGLILLPAGKYYISSPLILRSDIKIIGHSTSLIPMFNLPFQSIFFGESISNVRISGITFEGRGVYYESKFINKYNDFDFSKVTRVNFSNPFLSNTRDTHIGIGFNSLDIGISLIGKNSNIYIYNNYFKSLSTGIVIGDNNGSIMSPTEVVNINDNKFNNLGRAGVRLYNVNNLVIRGNLFSNILGNLVLGSESSISINDSKWADGISIVGSVNALIEQNIFMNINRIGIVLEGFLDVATNLPITINKNVTIQNNKFECMENSRGSEFNAGIWVEPYVNSNVTSFFKTESVVIVNNYFNNLNAKIGSHSQYGVRLGALVNIVESNQFFNYMTKISCPIAYSFGKTLLYENRFINTNSEICNLGDNKNHSALIKIRGQ